MILNLPGTRTALRKLVRSKRTRTHVPLPLGPERWGWMRRTEHHGAIPAEGLALLRDAAIVIGVTPTGRRTIVHGADLMRRIRESGQPGDVTVALVYFDGTARRAFPEIPCPGDDTTKDRYLLRALVDLAKNPHPRKESP